MATTQSNQQIEIASPLGKDVLLLAGFRGEESISRLFWFELDVLAEAKKDIAFDKLLGQKITVRLTDRNKQSRFFNGICNKIHHGETDGDFTAFTLEIVPQFWLLCQRTNSRIFQHISVPDILKKVLAGLDVTYQIQGTFHPRNYCVQYKESDFVFATRLMEEEGIYYLFTHSADGHKMVLANTPQSHPDVPIAPKIKFEKVIGGTRPDDRIIGWQKAQELVTGNVTLWDHSFELPHQNLEAKRAVQDSVAAGKVTHKIKAGMADARENYEYPGNYVNRFDGINAGGGERPADVQKIFEDNARTAAIRAQQEAVESVVIKGSSTCRNLISGHKFKLENHGHADGDYVLTSLQHDSGPPVNFRSAEGSVVEYSNKFTCIPVGLPFRPKRDMETPVIHGTQTATVVGPPGEEIFTDKYGRVKVQFNWDREGKRNADSSCWVRVGQIWAGNRWGASFWPRIGQEVLVAFIDGNPDEPVIVGSLYNAEQMPPYLGNGLDPKHPNDNKVSGIKSNTTPGGKGYNELRFDDAKDKEQVFIHAERNYDLRVKASSMTSVGGSSNLTVGGEKDGKKAGDIMQKVFKDYHHQVGNDEIRLVDHDKYDTVKNNKIEEVANGGHFASVPKGNTVQKTKALFVESQTDLVLKGKTVFINASSAIQLAVGSNFVKIDATGVTIMGTLTKINCPGSVPQPTPPTPPAPTLPAGKPTAGATTLKPEDPAGADNSVSGNKSAPK